MSQCKKEYLRILHAKHSLDCDFGVQYDTSVCEQFSRDSLIIRVPLMPWKNYECAGGGWNPRSVQHFAVAPGNSCTVNEGRRCSTPSRQGNITVIVHKWTYSSSQASSVSSNPSWNNYSCWPVAFISVLSFSNSKQQRCESMVPLKGHGDGRKN